MPNSALLNRTSVKLCDIWLQKVQRWTWTGDELFFPRPLSTELPFCHVAMYGKVKLFVPFRSVSWDLLSFFPVSALYRTRNSALWGIQRTWRRCQCRLRVYSRFIGCYLWSSGESQKVCCFQLWSSLWGEIVILWLALFCQIIFWTVLFIIPFLKI